MKSRSKSPQARREFLSQLGAATAILAASGGAASLAAQEEHGLDAGRTGADGEPWDTSWIEHVTSARYRVVFDATNIADGFALSLAGTFFDHYHEVHGTDDAQTRAVIVMRQLGTPLALGDVIWEKFMLGEELKINDRATGQPARVNPFHKFGSEGTPSLETLRSRGSSFLLCNIAMNNWSRRHADMVKRPFEEVREEVRSNLVPGTIVVPSGIYALIRAQNAGCAFMRGA